MGEASWHYFVSGKCHKCGHEELEIIDYANQDIAPVDGLIQVMVHPEGTVLEYGKSWRGNQGIYKGYCHKCHTTYEVRFLPGKDRIAKRSITLGA